MEKTTDLHDEKITNECLNLLQKTLVDFMLNTFDTKKITMPDLEPWIDNVLLNFLVNTGTRMIITNDVYLIKRRKHYISSIIMWFETVLKQLEEKKDLH